MIKILIASILITFALSVSLESTLVKHFESNKQADVIIHMLGHVDLNEFSKISNIDQRAQIMVDQLQAHAKSSQAQVTASLEAQNIDFTVMWNINAIYARAVNADTISSMMKFATIDYISLDDKIEVEKFEMDSVTPVENTKADVIEFNVEWVKATAVWKKGFEGQGIIVSVGDTGLNHLHEAIKPAYNGTKADGTFDHNYSWGDPAGKSREPKDTNGHGTHCSGTVAGGLKTNRKIGVAPKAKLIHCLALASIAAQILCMQWNLAPTDLDGKNPMVSRRPHVLSHSYNNWSCAPRCSPDYEKATKACILAGIAVVNSSGNRGPRCASINPNSRYPDQISVGATGVRTDDITSFSSRGPNSDDASILKPLITAPGQNVVSAAARQVNGYVAMSGTSMSTPNVAGGIALIWSAVPELKRNIQATNKVLGETAKKQTSNVCDPKGSPNGEYGFGTVDYEKAVKRALEMRANGEL